MGIKSRRVAFTFDDSSIKTLEEVREYGVSVSEVLNESPHFTRVLNLKTVNERVIVLPRFAAMADKGDVMTDPAPARMVIDQDALFSTLSQIQALEHQRQWCEMDALPAVEDELEIQGRHLKRLLCPGLSSTAPLPALTPPAPIAAPAQAEAEALIAEYQAAERQHRACDNWKEPEFSQAQTRLWDAEAELIAYKSAQALAPAEAE